MGIQEKHLAGVFQLLFPVLCCLLIRKLVHVPMRKASTQRGSAKGDGSKARRSGQCRCSHSKQSLKDFCFSGMKNSTLYSYKTLYVRSLPLWFPSSSEVSWSGEVSWWERIGFFCWAVALMSEHLKGNHRISRDQYFLYTLCIHYERRETCQHIHPMCTPLQIIIILVFEETTGSEVASSW